MDFNWIVFSSTMQTAIRGGLATYQQIASRIVPVGLFSANVRPLNRRRDFRMENEVIPVFENQNQDTDIFNREPQDFSRGNSGVIPPSNSLFDKIYNWLARLFAPFNRFRLSSALQV